MKKIFLCFLIFLSFYNIAFSQKDTTYIYTSLKEALLEPEKVERLTLKKQKLKEVPSQIFQFPNLRELNLASNKIKVIPKEIRYLTNLIRLDISNNYIENLPSEIGDLQNLKYLNLSRNDLFDLPSSMGNLAKLEDLILWSCFVTEFPKEMDSLKNVLLYLDLRAVQMNPKKQKAIKNMFPNTYIRMERACNCN